jgi:hypothetical protein
MRECGSGNFRLMSAVLVRIVLSGCGSGNLPKKESLPQPLVPNPVIYSTEIFACYF